MKLKSALLAGLAAGYVLGAKAGRERYEQIRAAARQVRDNPGVQRLSQEVNKTVAVGKEKVTEVASRGAEQASTNLADALPGDAELAADLFERARVAVGQAEAELDDLLLALAEGVQHRVELLLEQDEAGRVDRDDRVGVLDEVAEVGVLLLADGRLQADGLLADLEDLAHLLGRELHLAPDLLRRRLAAEVLQELALDADQLVDRLDHVHRDADGARLVGDGPGDRLADPPGRVRRELVALGVVELLDRADEAEVALLDQVEEQHAAAHVALGDRDDQAEVGLDQLLLGELAVALDPLQLAQAGGAELLGLGGGLVELGGGRLALLDRLGEDDLLLRGQERHLADLLEVHADGVVGGGLEGQVVVAGRAGLASELFGVQLVHHLDDFDVLVGEHLVDVVDLLCGQIDGSERLDHLFGGDEAAFLALDDEIPHLVELGFLGHGHRVSVPLV